ncbi:hypothetical protein ANCDUO_00248 [Ancylostoma duodenale]|uniref:Uncharacterized protein n=1 Tax=Ancylostoma duodenale TaxID=51022 RepID=A0A0C2DHI9_9BILA|nr:hypothetical protein ANCDUO_00248 [Ancylostoma duodenale]
MQARKIRYDVIGLTKTRRHRPLNATFDTGEELFLGTCDSRGVGGVGVFVNTNLVMNVDSFEQLTTRIGRLRLRRCGSMPTVSTFVAYAPTSSYDEEEIEAFYMDSEKFYREDHTFYKHLRDSAKKAEGSRATKRRLSFGTFELIRQRGAARAVGKYQLTSELAKRCGEAIKEDLKERRAAVLAEAAEAGKSIRNGSRDFANRTTQCSSCPSNGQNPLNDSGTREGQMEGLLAPARYVRRSTGVKVIKVTVFSGPSLPQPFLAYDQFNYTSSIVPTWSRLTWITSADFEAMIVFDTSKEVNH